MTEQRMRGHISLTNRIDQTFTMGQILLISNKNGSWIDLCDYDTEPQGRFRGVTLNGSSTADEIMQAAREAFHWIPLVKLEKLGQEVRQSSAVAREIKS